LPERRALPSLGLVFVDKPFSGREAVDEPSGGRKEDERSFESVATTCVFFGGRPRRFGATLVSFSLEPFLSLEPSLPDMIVTPFLMIFGFFVEIGGAEIALEDLKIKKKHFKLN
jgi:hypothetical protein